MTNNIIGMNMPIENPSIFVSVAIGAMAGVATYVIVSFIKQAKKNINMPIKISTTPRKIFDGIVKYILPFTILLYFILNDSITLNKYEIMLVVFSIAFPLFCFAVDIFFRFQTTLIKGLSSLADALARKASPDK